MDDAASELELVRVILNKSLHKLAYVFALLGFVRTPLRAIKKRHLIDRCSKLVILHSCYLTVKFSLVTSLCLYVNMKLDKHSIDVRSLNCKLANLETILERRRNQTAAPEAEANQTLGQYEGLAAMMSSAIMPNLLAVSDLLPDAGLLLDTFGGHLRLLDNRATLMFGVLAITIYITLAVYPIELIHFNIEARYNFLRFLLAEPSCMADIRRRRTGHLLRMASWSRYGNSRLTTAVKMMHCKRDLRINYKAIGHLSGCTSSSSLSPVETSFVLTAGSSAQHRKHPTSETHLEAIAEELFKTAGRKQPASGGGGRLRWFPSMDRAFKSRVLPRTTLVDVWRREPRINMSDQDYDDAKLHVTPHAIARQYNGAKRLEARQTINHVDGFSRRVRVASEELKQFEPFVRSVAWFKAVIVICPALMLFHISFLIVSYCLIGYVLDRSAWDIMRNCRHEQRQDEAAAYPVEGQTWSFGDRLIYHETIYSVFAISLSANFYCTYYFGTICELHVWTRELLQQLELSVHVIELGARRTDSSSLAASEARRHLASLMGADIINDFGGLRVLYPCLVNLGRKSSPRDHKRPTGESLKGSETILRASYVNMCLFFDEHRETRPVITIVMRRATEMAAGYAFMLAITRSQYKLNSGEYWYMNFTLIGLLLVFNLFLCSAAYLNNNINRLLARVHSLVAAHIGSGSQEVDMLEFWLARLKALNEELDFSAYNIYGCKVTWSSIAQFNSLIASLFFLTT